MVLLFPVNSPNRSSFIISASDINESRRWSCRFSIEGEAGRESASEVAPITEGNGITPVTGLELNGTGGIVKAGGEWLKFDVSSRASERCCVKG